MSSSRRSTIFCLFKNEKVFFDRLNEYKVIMNVSKSVYGVEEFKFLSYTVILESIKLISGKNKGIYRIPEIIVNSSTSTVSENDQFLQAFHTYCGEINGTIKRPIKRFEKWKGFRILK
jgi:hypothetical protein